MLSPQCCSFASSFPNNIGEVKKNDWMMLLCSMSVIQYMLKNLPWQLLSFYAAACAVA